jgi:hypothetical protein
MTTIPAEQVIVILTITRGDGKTSTTQITDRDVATDPLAQAAAAASSLVRLRPEVTVAVTANEAARHQHARTRDTFWFLGQLPCTCPEHLPADHHLLPLRRDGSLFRAGHHRLAVRMPAMRLLPRRVGVMRVGGPRHPGARASVR